MLPIVDLPSPPPLVKTIPTVTIEQPSVSPISQRLSPESIDLLKQNSFVSPKPADVESRNFPIKEISPSLTSTTPILEQPDTIELQADQQEYNQEQNVITATGNVRVNFPNGSLQSDKLQINLNTRLAVAQGNALLVRGKQKIQGDHLEYYFTQNQGTVQQALGEIYQPTLQKDTSPSPLPENIPLTDANFLDQEILSDRLLRNQPLSNVQAQQGTQVTLGGNLSTTDQGLTNVQPNTIGKVNHLRFQADHLDFNAEGWTATDVRFTNDPFSPPELQVRADTADYNQLSPTRSELITSRSRVVFDNRVSIPLVKNYFLFDQERQTRTLFNIGYDGEEQGGLFIERSFSVINTPKIRWTITPQYLVERAFFPGFLGANRSSNEGTAFDSSVFGVKSRLSIAFNERNTLEGILKINDFGSENFANKVRTNIRLEHLIGDLNAPHRLNLEYNFRDRLFNGSLGFQRVYSSLGLVLVSPNIPLGKTGINLNYQGGVQLIESDTDRTDLLSPNRTNNRITLTRYQTAISLNRGFTLWQGKSLPPTPTEGLKYTPGVVTPYIGLSTGINGLTSYYSNGETQQSLQASIGIDGQIGHFSKKFLDYTGFNISYRQAIRGEVSPFLFDRVVDERVLSFGITQQIYGPLRIGFQRYWNLDTNKEISTDYILEYRRRTYGVILRYNPVVELGSITFKLSDFNWDGQTEPFDP